MNDSTDKLDNKEYCSRCNDSGVVSSYNKDGDVASVPCPECTEDVMSHIRSWGGQMFDG